MSLGKCLTYGMGGFGKFASLISPYSTTCSAIHMTATQLTSCAVPRSELRLTRGIRKRKRKKQHLGEDGTQLFLPPMPKLKADLETAAAIKKKRIVVSRVQQTIQKEKPFPPVSGSPPLTAGTEKCWVGLSPSTRRTSIPLELSPCPTNCSDSLVSAAGMHELLFCGRPGVAMGTNSPWLNWAPPRLET